MPTADAPLFIVGVPRSGTSLFYKTLCLHPDAAWISNWVARYPVLPQLAVLNRIPRRFAGLQDRAWFDPSGDAYVYGRRRAVLTRVVPSPVEGEPVYRRAGVGDVVGDAGEAPARALRAALSTITRSAGGRQLINKRIANNRRIATLLKAFPEARFLHVVRDGRDVAASLARVDWWETSVVAWYGGTPREWRAEGGDAVELRARTWVEELGAIRSGLAEVPHGRSLTVRYEDVIREPARVMDDISAFAGMAADSRWRDRVRRRLGERPVGGQPLSEDDRRERGDTEAVQSRTLLELGYRLDGT